MVQTQQNLLDDRFDTLRIRRLKKEKRLIYFGILITYYLKSAIFNCSIFSVNTGFIELEYKNKKTILN